MSMQIRFEAWLLLLSLLVGCWLMLVYDLLRVLRLYDKTQLFCNGDRRLFLLDLCGDSHFYAAV